VVSVHQETFIIMKVNNTIAQSTESAPNSIGGLSVAVSISSEITQLYSGNSVVVFTVA